MKALILSLLVGAGGQLAAQQSDENQVRGVLESQLKSWNEGDIDQFMASYWNSDSLMFIGKSGITYGYINTLENYKKRYPTKEKMGTLRFNILKVTKLSPEYCFVVGKWMLGRAAGNLDGHFTLLFKKIDNHWVIISDHTS